jgi:hypothetical protein
MAAATPSIIRVRARQVATTVLGHRLPHTVVPCDLCATDEGVEYAFVASIDPTETEFAVCRGCLSAGSEGLRGHVLQLAEALDEHAVDVAEDATYLRNLASCQFVVDEGVAQP